MNDIEAIYERVSRRTYLNTPIDKDKIDFINRSIDDANKKSGLTIIFVEDGSKAFNSFGKSYGMFKGVRSIILLKGEKADPNLKEKVGYYGEILALEATKLGLGTCWVGGTFDRAILSSNKNEEIVCVLTVGNVPLDKPLKERMIYKVTHRKTKSIEEFYDGKGTVPDWFIDAIKAVQKAPSAINSQKFRFNYREGEIIASIPNTYQFDLVDLGIAKLHFELSAGCKFELGNHVKLKL